MRTKATFTAVALGILALLGTQDAQSASTPVTANIRFDTPLNLNKTADIDFGSVTAGQSNTYTISPTGSTSVSGTGSGAYLFGSTHAASITISGSATNLMNISVGGYTANNGVTPSNATCKYGTASAGSCSITGAAAPTGTGTTLLVGADVAADGTQTAGTTATPSFTVTVVYQ